MANILSNIQHLVSVGFDIYRTLLAVYYLLSWFPGAQESAFGQFLGRIFEPYLRPFREHIPPFGYLSVASIVAYACLYLIEEGVLVVLKLITRLFL